MLTFAVPCVGFASVRWKVVCGHENPWILNVGRIIIIICTSPDGNRTEGPQAYRLTLTSNQPPPPPPYHPAFFHGFGPAQDGDVGVLFFSLSRAASTSPSSTTPPCRLSCATPIKNSSSPISGQSSAS